MSQNHRKIDDAPLFDNDEIIDCDSDDFLSIQEYNSREENHRKNRIIDFCIKAAVWVAIFSLVIIGADFCAQSLGFNSDLIKDCFSLITYLATAASGFLFGSNSK